MHGAARFHHVHRQRQEHRAARRGLAVLEGAMHQDRDLIGRGDLDSPLARGPRDRDEIALQQRIGDRMPRILLAGGDDQRCARSVGVEQVAHAVTEAAGRVQVDEARLAGGLRVAVGHRHHARFLQAEHVVQARSIGQRVDQRQFRRAGIAEDVFAVLAFEHVEENVGTGAHDHRIASSPAAHRPPAQCAGRRCRRPARCGRRIPLLPATCRRFSTDECNAPCRRNLPIQAGHGVGARSRFRSARNSTMAASVAIG